MFELADGGKVAVRGSGTEPKIKYYLFAAASRRRASRSREELAEIKPAVAPRSTRRGPGCKRTPTSD